MISRLGAALGVLLSTVAMALPADERSSGWILVYSQDPKAPLAQWLQIAVHDQAADCQKAVTGVQTMARTGKFPDGKPARVEIDSVADLVKKGGTIKCAPADAYYRAQEGRP